MNDGDVVQETTVDDKVVDDPIIDPKAVESGEDAGGSLLTDADKKATDDKDADGEDADSSNDDVPDEYADFTLPEGMTLDPDLLAEAGPVFKDLGLTQDQAQKLIDLQSKKAEADVQKQMTDFNQMIDDWKDQSQNDKEFGGDKFDESVAVAREAIDKFGTPALKDLLSEHGVGNHPEVIRFMVKVGQLTREKNIDGGMNPAAGGPADRVDQLYPKT
jgi:hypothetical protein|tara:strand:- start:1584 stop:2234 length:651 start_codon:yes stop_codon:yes gene_type:complete